MVLAFAGHSRLHRRLLVAATVLVLFGALAIFLFLLRHGWTPPMAMAASMLSAVLWGMVLLDSGGAVRSLRRLRIAAAEAAAIQRDFQQLRADDAASDAGRRAVVQELKALSRAFKEAEAAYEYAADELARASRVGEDLTAYKAAFHCAEAAVDEEWTAMEFAHLAAITVEDEQSAVSRARRAALADRVHLLRDRLTQRSSG